MSDGKYRLLNGSEDLELTFDITYTLEDENDEEQEVIQTLSLTYSFNDLFNGFDLEVVNVTDFINKQLETISDINPTDTIEEIEDHFRFHRYGYTRYLLSNLEKEQIIDIIEHLGLSSSGIAPLTSIIDPNPLAITENLIIFKLKESHIRSRDLGERFNTTIRSGLFNQPTDKIGGTGFRKPIIHNGIETTMYQVSAQQIPADKPFSTKQPSFSSNMTLYIGNQSDQSGKYPVEGSIDLITYDRGITRKQPITIAGSATKTQDNNINIAYKVNKMFGEHSPHEWEGDIDVIIHVPDENEIDITDVIKKYCQSVDQYEEQMRARPKWATVFLPTAGVFGEAILGVSNGSEFINLKRFYNWQDSPIPNMAPNILPVNANQNYSQPISDSINPTVPVSVLNQMNPVPFPDTSLGTALQAIQNGTMFADMSKAEQLTSTLSTLAQLANNTAQLSGNLAGDAAANSLKAAVELGKQVASMISEAMNSSVNSPPETQTAIGGALGLLDQLSTTNPTPNEQAQANAVGAPIPVPVPPNQNNPQVPNDGESPQDDDNTGTSNVLFSEVEMKIDTVDIKGGERFSENVIEMLNAILALFQVIPEMPDWVAPEIAEMFRPFSTVEVKGTLILRDPDSRMIVEQKTFSIKATDAFVFIKNGESHTFSQFNQLVVPLSKPIYALRELNGTQTITAFANIDPVSFLDLALNTMFAVSTGSIASLLGIDELNLGSWTVSIAEYAAIMSNAVFGSNSYSQNVEYFTNLRENWSKQGLALYVNNKIPDFQFIIPLVSAPDICVAVPTSPPRLIVQ